MTRLTLYTTLGCHLCEQLEGLLAALHQGDYTLTRVEISEDAALVERYGVRIPVLVDAAGAELERGFEPERLAAWLAQRGVLDARAWAAGPTAAAPATPAAPHSAVSRRGRRYLGSAAGGE